MTDDQLRTIFKGGNQFSEIEGLRDVYNSGYYAGAGLTAVAGKSLDYSRSQAAPTTIPTPAARGSGK